PSCSRRPLFAAPGSHLDSHSFPTRRSSDLLALVKLRDVQDHFPSQGRVRAKRSSYQETLGMATGLRPGHVILPPEPGKGWTEGARVYEHVAKTVGYAVPFLRAMYRFCASFRQARQWRTPPCSYVF